MQYRYIVEIINAGKSLSTPHLEIGYNNKDKAILCAGKWNTKGHSVVIHNVLTGERNILSNN